MYDVVYFVSILEGYAIKTFDNLADALKFSEHECEVKIYSYKQAVPLAYNIDLYFN